MLTRNSELSSHFKRFSSTQHHADQSSRICRRQHRTPLTRTRNAGAGCWRCRVMRAGGANGRVGLQRQKGARRYSLVLTDGKRQGVLQVKKMKKTKCGRTPVDDGSLSLTVAATRSSHNNHLHCMQGHRSREIAGRVSRGHNQAKGSAFCDADASLMITRPLCSCMLTVTCSSNAMLLAGACR